MTGYQSKRAAAQEKLAQPEQEPVALLPKVDVCMRAEAHGIDPNTNGLYGFYVDCVSSSPPQRQWVDLTDEEKNGKRVLENGLLFNAAEVQAWELGVEYAEAKLKEANA